THPRVSPTHRVGRSGGHAVIMAGEPGIGAAMISVAVNSSMAVAAPQMPPPIATARVVLILWPSPLRSITALSGSTAFGAATTEASGCFPRAMAQDSTAQRASAALTPEPLAN